MRKMLQAHATALFMLGALFQPVAILAASPEFSRFAISEADAGERELLLDAADGRLDEFELLDAALIASGVEQPAQRRRAKHSLDSRWLEVGEPLIAKLAPHDRTKAIFIATHRLLLTGKYDADCTEIQRTLASGDYNCVTATLLFMELCRRNKIETSAVAVPGHVYCRLEAPSPIDVQTTCKDWFDARASDAKSKLSATIQQQLAQPASPPRQLSHVQLLGKIYYNRGVSALEKHEYAAAIALLKTSLALDAFDEPARNNLLAAYNNWALHLCDRGEFAAAASKLADGATIDNKYAPLHTNDLYVHQKWVLSLCDSGRYSAALELLEKGYQRRPEAALFDGGRYAVYGMWSKSLLEANRVSDALAVLKEGRRRYGNQEELIHQEIQAFEKAVNYLLKQKDSRAAKLVCTVAMQRYPEAESIQKLATQIAAK